MKRFCVIVAAGSGARMGNPLPKQLLPVLGRPLMAHTADAFIAAFSDIHLVVVMHPDHLDAAHHMLAGYPNTTVLRGAASRTGSVRAGLQHVDDDSIVFIHDAVRCLVTPALIRRCDAVAREKGNAIPAVVPVDSLRWMDGERNECLDRSRVRLIQTPQTFQARLLKQAYSLAGDRDFTDDALVLEHSGQQIHLVEGETTNIKVTYPADLLVAEMILKQRKPIS